MNKNGLLLKYLAFDFIAAMLVWILIVVYRKTLYYGSPFFDYEIYFPNFDYNTSLLLIPLACLFVHYLSGFYYQPERKKLPGIFFTTLVSTALISIVIFFVLIIDDVVISYKHYYYSLLMLFGAQFLLTYLFRMTIAHGVKRKYKSKEWTINTLIVGTGSNAQKMAKELEDNSEEYTLVGFVSIDQYVRVPKDKVLGSMTQLAAIIKNHQVEDAIIALEKPDELKLFSLINELYRYNIDIRFTPGLYEILTGASRVKMLGVSPLINITSPAMLSWELSVKRFFDLLVSAVAMVLLSPLFVYLMLLIKKDSIGPVFYRQERIGYLGRPFQIFKFRTMYTDSENGMPKLSSANDDRITPVGRMLRKYRLDELPQFWNVFKGEMSLVGPRPERRFFINQIIETAPYYCLLYKVRPGLTSWGPIKVGYTDTVDKMIERLNYDIIYIENMSLINDLKILIFTVEIIFKGKGV